MMINLLEVCDNYSIFRSHFPFHMDSSRDEAIDSEVDCLNLIGTYSTNPFHTSGNLELFHQPISWVLRIRVVA